MIINRDLKFIKQAMKLASCLEHDINSKHAAMLVTGNKIISVGVNKVKGCPAQKKYQRISILTYTHAEIDCLRNVQKHKINSKSTLYVVRYDARTNTLKHSAPCEGCKIAIADYKIPRVIYSTNEFIHEINID